MPADDTFPPPIGRLSAIVRYPIKGIGGQFLDKAVLSAGEAIGGDRLLALGRRAGAPIVAWRSKNHFHHLADRPAMGRWRCDLDDSTLTIRRGSQIAARARIDPTGKRELAAFFHQALDAASLIECHRGSFSDRKTQGVSIVGLETVRELSRRLSHPLDPLRFRANLYIEGTPAWGEERWIGQCLIINDVTLRVIEPIFRCPAIEVPPGGEGRDTDILAALSALPRSWVGVLARVESGGVIRPRDGVHGHRQTPQTVTPDRRISSSDRRSRRISDD